MAKTERWEKLLFVESVKKNGKQEFIINFAEGVEKSAKI